jgi:hypothetical protein
MEALHDNFRLVFWLALIAEIGPSATFIAGAAFTALGLFATYVTRRVNPVA